MKNFVVALIFLTVVTASVFINSFYARGMYEDLLEKLENFPKSIEQTDVSPAIEETGNFIEEKIRYLYLTVPQNQINEFLMEYSEMLGYYYSGDETSYTACVEKVKLRIKLLRKNELLPVFGETNSKKRYFP